MTKQHLDKLNFQVQSSDLQVIDIGTRESIIIRVCAVRSVPVSSRSHLSKTMKKKFWCDTTGERQSSFRRRREKKRQKNRGVTVGRAGRGRRIPSDGVTRRINTIIRKQQTRPNTPRDPSGCIFVLYRGTISPSTHPRKALPSVRIVENSQLLVVSAATGSSSRSSPSSPSQKYWPRRFVRRMGRVKEFQKIHGPEPTRPSHSLHSQGYQTLETKNCKPISPRWVSDQGFPRLFPCSTMGRSPHSLSSTPMTQTLQQTSR